MSSASSDESSFVDDDEEDLFEPPLGASKGKGKAKSSAKAEAASVKESGKKRKKSHSSEGVVDEEDLLVTVAANESKGKGKSSSLPKGVDRYCVELAKSSRTSCRQCNTSITKGELRGGVVLGEGRWGPITAWHHLRCIIFQGITLADEIEGFEELDEENQEEVSSRLEVSRDLEDENYKPIDPDELVRQEWTQRRPTPKGLLMPLLPYQEEGLGWLCHQEESEYRGGILADEMGLGKTIQAISLILEHRRPSPRATCPEWDAIEREMARKPNPKLRGGTLVICPMIAMLQWQAEVQKFVREGLLSVVVHHGSKRSSLAEDLVDYDVVITTYPVLEAEHRKMNSKAKVPCPACGKRLYSDKMPFHLKYFCGEGAERTEAQAKTIRKAKKSKMAESSNKEQTVLPPKTRARTSKAKQALKKVPAKRRGKYKGGMTMLPSDNDEEEQTKKRAPGKKSHSGNGQIKMTVLPSDDEEASYSSSSSEEEEADSERALPGSSSPAALSVLQTISWYRVIADESHYFKARSTATAKAMFALTSLHKVCLTGTPLQNRVSELYSQVRFLRLDPYAYYMCRKSGCECKSLNYRFGPMWNKCEECGHTPMQHYSVFNREILNPIARAGYVGEGRKGFLTLKNNVLDKILLRRTKDSRSEDIPLPLRTVRVRSHRLSPGEDDFYQALYTQGQAQFDTYVNAGVIMHNISHIFDVLIRLRQAVDHPYLVIYSNTKREGMDAVGSGSATGVIANTSVPASLSGPISACAICNEDPEMPVTAECGHIFCHACVKDLIETVDDGPGIVLECPECSQPLTVDLQPEDELQPPQKQQLQGKGHKGCSGSGSRRAIIPAGKFQMSSTLKSSIINRIDLSKFQSSTKLEALMQELHSMMERDPAAKAIVFSQFVNMLDLAEYRIKMGGIDCRKISGHMSVDVRDDVIKSFQENPSVKVLLISLKAGGVALNLTVANYLFLLDPWWNPAAEDQAIDRIHRIGQHKPIRAVRFIIEDSIEERILKLQEKKKLVFNSTVGADAGSLAKLTVDDLRFLFSPGGSGRSS